MNKSEHKQKRALCIGINYINTKTASLMGCINDSLHIQKLLLENFSFQVEDIVVLNDNLAMEDEKYPSKKNILKWFDWLVENVEVGDVRVLSNASHGGLKKDLNSDEMDGQDSTLFPADFMTSGAILDDDIRALLDDKMPKNSRLIKIMDLCHSGTVSDLQHNFGTKSLEKSREIVQMCKNNIYRTTISCPIVEKKKIQYYVPKVINGLLFYVLVEGTIVENSSKEIKNNEKKNENVDIPYRFNAKAKSTNCFSVCFSGCSDKSTSADAYVDKKSQGAMTFAFIKAVKHLKALNGNIRLDKLWFEINSILRENNYTQIAQISLGHTNKIAEEYLEF